MLFNDTATTEIYTLSLHDALPICGVRDGGVADLPVDLAGPLASRLVERHTLGGRVRAGRHRRVGGQRCDGVLEDGEIGRAHGLNSSHANISYAVFCLKNNALYNHF